MSHAAHRPILAAPLRFELEGGALALLEEAHAVPLVSLVIALRTGAASDPPGKEGLARVAMRMLRRGCESMSSEQIDRRIDVLGAEMAIDTSSATVAIHAQVIARNLPAFVDLLARILASPTFPDDELQRLKRESIAEIIDARDSDRVVAQKAMQRTLFEGHPYGRNAGGTIASVDAIEGADVAAFYKRFVVRANIVLGLSGDVAADGATQMARQLIAGLEVGVRAADDVPEPVMRPGRRLLLVDKPERTQTQLLVATLGTSAHDPDHVALYVANAVFGGTFTSRLMKEVRSKRGWSYGASARTAVDRHRQAWLMWTFPAAEDAAPCLELMLTLMEHWVQKGVTPREIAFIKSYLVRSHAFEIDTAAKRLHQALDVELLALPSDYFTTWIDRVRTVTAEEASKSVRERIRTDDLLVTVVATAAKVLEPMQAAVPLLAETSVVPFDVE
ncbi:MAG: insulinase family protein [Myxococcota bacterium]|nr:insulinase family protein [Myxococcota bacterium]